MSDKILIKNGEIFSSSKSFIGDILIEDERIVKISDQGIDEPANVINAEGKYVLPGIIDAHTHMGVPAAGTYSSDDFESGSKAAVFGGVTTIIDFTVQEKGESLFEALNKRLDEALYSCYIDFSLHCNVTDCNQKTLTEIPRVIRCGIPSFKVFLTYEEAGMMITEGNYMLLARRIRDEGGILMVHAESDKIVKEQTHRLISNGKTGFRYHSESRDNTVEEEGIRQAIELNSRIGCNLYIVHVSTEDGIKLGIERKKEAGYSLFLETCPHYLVLNQTAYEREGGWNYVTTPPLRGEKDNAALWNALQNNQIDVIATDHCPFTRKQKEGGNGEFLTTPNGLPGVETLLTVTYNEGINKERISVNKLVETMCENPAKIFGLYPRKGVIHEGSDADLVVFDPNKRVTIKALDLHSNTDFNPYEGMEVKGYPETVISRGRIVVDKNKFSGDKKWGNFIKAKLESADGVS
ncbi:dihydropyrimidinase [bacterium]|nr:dihydropyrimidinase [bacterium]